MTIDFNDSRSFLQVLDDDGFFRNIALAMSFKLKVTTNEFWNMDEGRLSQLMDELIQSNSIMKVHALALLRLRSNGPPAKTRLTQEKINETYQAAYNKARHRNGTSNCLQINPYIV